jgi:hypothetical protein
LRQTISISYFSNAFEQRLPNKSLLDGAGLGRRSVALRGEGERFAG